jgi:FKBP-type peptidyl-prolyl cis-trans isomerase
MDKKFRVLGIIVVAIIGIFSSCKKDNISFQEMRDNEVDLRERYIERWHEGAVARESGLYYFEETTGESEDTIETGDVVEVFYRGYLIQDDPLLGVTNGHNFDSKIDYEPFSFVVGGGRVIAGWDEAIRLMKEGTEAKLVIPSRLAYSNSTQNPDIPRYSTLVFYITVHKVTKSDDDPIVIERNDNGPWL